MTNSSRVTISSIPPTRRFNCLLAKRAVGDAKDPWEKAKRVERYVNQNMKSFTFSEALMTADQVAKNLSGDCTEYAMLAAAMCRAVGVPSRTVLGLVDAQGPRGRPFLASVQGTRHQASETRTSMRHRRNDGRPPFLYG